MHGGVGDKKIRSDKKVDLKATLSVQSKERLRAFSAACNEPLKDVSERFLSLALYSRIIISELCVWFRRNYIYDNSIAFGDLDRPKIVVKSSGPSDVVSLKLRRPVYEKLCELAHALDIPPSTTVSLLLVSAMNDPQFMKDYMDQFLSDMDPYEIKEIKKILGGSN